MDASPSKGGKDQAPCLCAREVSEARKRTVCARSDRQQVCERENDWERERNRQRMRAREKVKIFYQESPEKCIANISSWGGAGGVQDVDGWEE